MSEPCVRPGGERCWSLIGVWGDGSCSDLARVVHCHNCEHFIAAGRSLLEREADDSYRQEWTELLSRAKEQERATLSVMIFRLGSEWLAISTRFLQEVNEPQVIRTLPHRSGSLLRGLVNIRGELLLCVSLQDLLGIAGEPEQAGEQRSVTPTDSHHGPGQLSHSQASHEAWPRLVVIAEGRDRWAFTANEVWGIRPINPAALREVPATVTKNRSCFTRGLLSWKERTVGLLDGELLLSALRRRVLHG